MVKLKVDEHISTHNGGEIDKLMTFEVEVSVHSTEQGTVRTLKHQFL